MSYSSEVLADSPVAYFHLDESSGTTAADSSGNGLDATWTAAPTWGVAGAIGGGGTAITAPGGTGRGRFTSTAFRVALSACTAEAWIKTTTTTGTHVILAFDLGSSNRKLQLRMLAGGLPSFGVFIGGSFKSAAGTTNIADGKWHHVVGVYDGAHILLYVDGAQVASTAQTGNVDAAAATVGCIANIDDGSVPFSGSIDEPAVYTTGLSSGRVTAHYNAAHNVNAGVATETDTAQPGSRRKQRAGGGAVAETDAAQPGTRRKTLHAGVATETDTAPHGTIPGHAGVAAETDAAQAATRVKTLHAGVATETDTALPVNEPVIFDGDLMQAQLTMLAGDVTGSVDQGAGIYDWGLIMLQGTVLDDGLADVYA